MSCLTIFNQTVFIIINFALKKKQQRNVNYFQTCRI